MVIMRTISLKLFKNLKATIYNNTYNNAYSIAIRK